MTTKPVELPEPQEAVCHRHGPQSVVEWVTFTTPNDGCCYLLVLACGCADVDVPDMRGSFPGPEDDPSGSFP